MGRITLNRPQALNALTHEMCRAIHQRLARWAVDDAVRLVVIDGAGERAFRSEEHTSELQSLMRISYAVFCLKKKHKKKTKDTIQQHTYQALKRNYRTST